MKIKLKRVYEAPAASDGKRVLVERLWPRGISKDEALLYCWIKEIAPSTELRKWYNHQPERWQSFQAKYRHELCDKSEVVSELSRICQDGLVTLVFASKDEAHNSAVVLKQFLENRENKG